MKVSIIIPCYNEEDTIGEVLCRLLNSDVHSKTEIIVVDDASTDNSAEVVRSFSGVNLLVHAQNKGKGEALRFGLAQSSGDIIAIQDADMEYLPEDLLTVIDPIVKGDADFVLGSRFMGKYEGMRFSHFLGNKLLSLAISVLFGQRITDVMTGHKAFKRRFVDLVDFRSRGFEVEVEMVSKAITNGLRILEVPIHYSYRRRGVSKIRWRDGFRCVLALLESRLLMLRSSRQRQTVFFSLA